jgi:hypothetical protein
MRPEGWLGLLILMILLLIAYLFGSGSGYRRGQVDALNGQWKFTKSQEQVTKYYELPKPMPK